MPEGATGDVEFVLPSSKDGHLRLVLAGSTAGRAELSVPGLDARCAFHERWGGAPLGLADYFRTLAENWRGWEGSLKWEGIGLELTASHDGLGHVELWATLTHPSSDAQRWLVRAALSLDAGRLEQHARDAALFDAAFDAAV